MYPKSLKIEIFKIRKLFLEADLKNLFKNRFWMWLWYKMAVADVLKWNHMCFFLATGIGSDEVCFILKKARKKVSELQNTDWFDNRVLNWKSHTLIVQNWQLSWTYVAIRGKIWWCSNTNLLKSFQFCKTDMTWKGPYNHELKWCKKFLKSVPLL